MMKLLVPILLAALLCSAMTPASAVGEARTPGDPAFTLKPMRGVKRVLFLGDSITYAGGYVEEIESCIRLHAPELRCQLIDAGLPSETVSGLTEPNHAGGAFPRPDLHERLDRALAKIKPDLVVACYGMNDGIYYPFDTDRLTKYQDGIQWLAERVRRSGAKLWLLTPPPFDPQPVRASLLPEGRSEYPSGQGYEGYDTVLARYSDWLLSQRQKGWKVTDIHTPLNAYLADRRGREPSFAFAGDGVHLNAIGHRLIVREVLRSWGAPEPWLPDAEPPALPPAADDAIAQVRQLVHEKQRLVTDAWLNEVGHKRPGMAKGVPVAEAERKAAELDGRIRAAAAAAPPPLPGAQSDYHGYTRHDFQVDGCKATVVTPHRTMSGYPWIWRAEFFDHRPELDLALLKLGFHLAYIEVGNTFGAPSAMKHWDAFYKELTQQIGLNRRTVLEGLSRGGLYIYNWAAANPTKVSVLYGDNPVCDFKSWPGGKGKGPGSPGDWRKLIQDYGFSSEADALFYRKNPIDNLAPLARARVPIVHLCGDADEVVPYSENTVILKERYEELGGEIKVIVKPGFKHHPHGLDDPTLLVEFILAHMQRH